MASIINATAMNWQLTVNNWQLMDRSLQCDLEMNADFRWQSVAEMVRRVSSGRGRELAGRYSIEGTRLVERALRAGAALETVITTTRYLADPRRDALQQALYHSGVSIVQAPEAVLTELTEARDLGHILGLVRLPVQVELKSLLRSPLDRGQQPDQPTGQTSDIPIGRPLFLAAVDIRDPGNVGALTRTAHAGGATALLVAGASDPFHPRATRISRGSIFKLPIVRYGAPADLLDDLRRSGVTPIVTAAEGGVPLATFLAPRNPAAVLMGNEAEGLPPAIAAAVEFHVTIPMAAGVDSYSVNAAAAIILYALRQQAVQQANHAP